MRVSLSLKYRFIQNSHIRVIRELYFLFQPVFTPFFNMFSLYLFLRHAQVRHFFLNLFRLPSTRNEEINKRDLYKISDDFRAFGKIYN